MWGIGHFHRLFLGETNWLGRLYCTTFGIFWWGVLTKKEPNKKCRVSRIGGCALAILASYSLVVYCLERAGLFIIRSLIAICCRDTLAACIGMPNFQTHLNVHWIQTWPFLHLRNMLAGRSGRSGWKTLIGFFFYRDFVVCNFHHHQQYIYIYIYIHKYIYIYIHIIYTWYIIYIINSTIYIYICMLFYGDWTRYTGIGLGSSEMGSWDTPWGCSYDLLFNKWTIV